jgi:NADH:ubiquinone oxidoreductase subunit 4 (subunit M)
MLSFLIFMPIVTVPSLFFFKKDFQIKMLAWSTGLIHFFLTVGLISKSGYRFSGFQLREVKPLLYSLGFNYSLALNAAALQFLVFASALFLLVLSFSYKNLSKREVIVMLILQSCCFGAVLTSDLLLYSIFLEFAALALIFIGGFKKEKTFSMLILSFMGLFFMILASTTFSILYESIHLEPSLDFLKLDEMKTPFIKNSLFSTQTILFLSFALGLLLKVFSVFHMINSSESRIRLKKMGQSFLLMGVLLFGYYRLTHKLFPEIKAVYLNNGSYDLFLSIGVLSSMSVFYFFKIYQTKKMEN